MSNDFSQITPNTTQNPKYTRGFTRISGGGRYTYTDFVNDVFTLTEGVKPNAEELGRIKAKATDLMGTQANSGSMSSAQRQSGSSFASVTGNARYTYIDLATDVIALANGAIADDAIRGRMVDKAIALLDVQKTTALTSPVSGQSGSTSVASAHDSQKIADDILTVLSYQPMTAAEINTVMDTEYTSLQILNAMKLCEQEVASEKVIRTTLDAKGLRAEREYTAWRKK